MLNLTTHEQHLRERVLQRTKMTICASLHSIRISSPGGADSRLSGPTRTVVDIMICQMCALRSLLQQQVAQGSLGGGQTIAYQELLQATAEVRRAGCWSR